MVEIGAALVHWQMDMSGVRERMYRSPTPRERERWHAIWLLAQGWTAAKVAELLERDPHTIGDWLSTFVEGGPPALAFEQTGGPPRPRRCGAGRSERSGAAAPAGGGSRLGELVLEGSQGVRLDVLWQAAQPHRLH